LKKIAFPPVALEKDFSLLTGLLRMNGQRLVIDNDNHSDGGGRARYTSPSLLTKVYLNKNQEVRKLLGSEP
jgi:hypothetical protein